jgi:hypothetical protein
MQAVVVAVAVTTRRFRLEEAVDLAVVALAVPAQLPHAFRKTVQRAQTV